MSITETRIELDEAETDEIIRDDEADRAYIIEVVGQNPIRVDHRERYATDGTTLSAGQSHTVSNLRGKRLYAAAHAGPSAIRVREAAADVSSQPERNVTIEAGEVNVESVDVEDRPAREIGKARLQDSGGVLIDPATATKQDEIISLLEQIEENTSS